MSKRRRSRHAHAGCGSGIRTLRLEELLRAELRSLLADEVRDRRLEGARVTRVELSMDGSRARVWFIVDGAVDCDPATAFERAKGFLRCRLCDALGMKRTPELCFRQDPVALVEGREGEGI